MDLQSLVLGGDDVDGHRRFRRRRPPTHRASSLRRGKRRHHQGLVAHRPLQDFPGSVPDRKFGADADHVLAVHRPGRDQDPEGHLWLVADHRV